ncbi:MAG TPA: DASS family sodium-coupled anion symporter [Longimicrobiales bacterium]|nr:DASS family sodium-coupled anion symporter [Longimicrobiales bacterium]
MDEGTSHKGMHGYQRVGPVLGAVAFFLMLLVPPPATLGSEGWRTAAVAVLMATWWMTEAIPIPVTALLPLVLFPALGILAAPEASAPYANELIYLFMGGFLLAAALEKWGLHRRIALRIMSWVGTKPSQLVLGFMVATAFLSMWISNTATAAMMFPIALAVGEMLRPKDHEGVYHFGIALMLSVAYAASIGGIATLIGTPPNAVLAGAASEMLGRQIGFLEWMAVGVPVTALMIPLAWLLLVKVMHPPGKLSGDAAEIIEAERAKLGPMSKGERVTATVFALTALAWVMREEKDLGAFVIPGIETWMPAVRDSTIAMLAAAVLFVWPTDWKKGEFALDWKTARKIEWGVLVLFGGGLSLAAAMDQSGVAAWIGGVVAQLGNVPEWVAVVAVATLLIFLTELTSNVAVTAMAMPVMAGTAAALGIDPMLLMTTAAIGASMAFMLPVATPPNAIVFSSGYLTVPQMARVGFFLNLIAIVVVTILSETLIPLFLL